MFSFGLGSWCQRPITWFYSNMSSILFKRWTSASERPSCDELPRLRMLWNCTLCKGKAFRQAAPFSSAQHIVFISWHHQLWARAVCALLSVVVCDCACVCIRVHIWLKMNALSAFKTSQGSGFFFSMRLWYTTFKTLTIKPSSIDWIVFEI